MATALDRVTWRVSLADINYSPAWQLTTDWVAQTGTHAQTAGTVTSGITLTFNRTPTINTTAAEAFGTATTVAVTAGKRYRVSATVRHIAGKDPVRVGLVNTVLSQSTLVTGEPETISVEWVATSTTTVRPAIYTTRGKFDVTVEVSALSFVEVGRNVAVDTEEGVSIRYGRPSWLDSTEPSSAVFSLLAGSTLTPPSVGDRVCILARVTTTPILPDDPSYMDLPRFTGTVTGVTFTPGHYAVTATGPLTQVNLRSVGAAAFPSESEVARFRRILSGAGVTGDVVGTARMTMKPRAAGLTPAGQLLATTAIHTGSFITETRTGDVVVLTAQSLDDTPTVLTIDPEFVMLEPYSASRDTGGIVNSVSVSYGSENPTEPTWEKPKGGTKPVYTASDATSIAAFGTRFQSYDTELNDLASATNLGNWLIEVLASARWEVSTMEVAAQLADATDAFFEVAQLTAGQGIYIPASPDYGPLPDYRAVVMGWEETISGSAWHIKFNLGAFRVAALGTIAWVEAPSTVKWNTTTTQWRKATTVASLTA